MITAQDIRDKTFEKSKIGGYDMAAVDVFLEEIAEDITASQKESAILKSKMKVLVDKIEEYRSNESALNQAVISAQKLAQQIEEEAREKAAKMIADAEAVVNEKLGGIEAQTEIENKRLADAKAASSKFIDGIRAMCNAQLKNLDNISGVIAAPKAEVPAEPVPAANDKEVEEVANAVGDAISRIKHVPTIQLDLSADMDAPAAAEDAFDSTQPFTL